MRVILSTGNLTLGLPLDVRVAVPVHLTNHKPRPYQAHPQSLLSRLDLRRPRLQPVEYAMSLAFWREKVGRS